MDELKRIVAENLIRLRQNSGMTQADLGEKLNYSDKTVSKWERAESLPDVYVLKQISTIFGVTIDMLLSPHGKEDFEIESTETKEKERSYSSNMITMISVFSIWTLALLIFVVLWVNKIVFPLVFLVAIPISLVVLLVMRSVWNQGRYNYWVVAALVLSLFVLVYFCFWSSKPWQMWLLVIPAELLVYMGFRVKRR
jgi:transcriptional regulator with XRE-family HTH domain